MIIKFDRMQIAAVNSDQSDSINKAKALVNSKNIAVPEKETFKYVFENAKKGNEMAAVLLDEWQTTCEPRDNRERQIVQLINRAADRIFK